MFSLSQQACKSKAASSKVCRFIWDIEGETAGSGQCQPLERGFWHSRVFYGPARHSLSL